jgi:hypothetical protein
LLAVASWQISDAQENQFEELKGRIKGHIMDLSNQYPSASHIYTSPELLFIT